jgi:hypothetical protein
MEYEGEYFSDSIYTSGPQVIPGKLQCEYYDIGGEGIAYHDSDSVNSGSGILNPADGTYLHEFRMDGAVDISYTKSNNIDNNSYNKTEPLMNQLYVGWTEAGEWTRYTVHVKTSGMYSVGLMYTANGDGKVGITVNNKDVSGPLTVPSTHNDADTLAWRQWHHWNYVKSLTVIELHKGMQLIGLHTLANGNMNYDYLDFTLIH